VFGDIYIWKKWKKIGKNSLTPQRFIPYNLTYGKNSAYRR